MCFFMCSNVVVVCGCTGAGMPESGLLSSMLWASSCVVSICGARVVCLYSWASVMLRVFLIFAASGRVSALQFAMM